MESSRQAVITVRDAYKTFKPNVVLRGLNMTVTQGHIYGLLGPSGCGKTTLLKCILGRQRLDAGEITVNPRDIQNIGYMPQELSLYNELSIQETLVYYGMLYGMSRADISQRAKRVLQLLELPSKHTIVQSLSGGQKRRVSLSVAFIHNPQLLLLDEPTVGVDIVLSRKIWDHLIHLSTTEQKTIVITTHYVEEARKADMIGLMREGLLLAEESPEALIESCNCDSLEQAFLHLSQQQANALSTAELQDLESYTPFRSRSRSPLDNGTNITLHRFRAQILKSFYWMKRNKSIMFFVTFMPVMCTFVFNFCIGNDPVGLPVAVFNAEVSSGEECAQYPLNSCYLESHISCRFLDRLGQLGTFHLIEFNSLDEGEEALKTNIVWGLLHFPKNYSASYLERIDFTFLNNPVFEFGNIDAVLDMSNMYIGNLIKRDLITTFITFQKELFRDCGWPEQLGDIPIRFNDAVFGSNNPDFKHYSGAAAVSLFSFILPAMFTTAALLSDKTQGLLERSLVSGMSIYEVLIAHSVIQFVLILLNTFMMLVVCYVIFDHPMVGNLTIFIGLIILIALSGMCFGFVVALVCDSEIAATTVGLGCLFSNAFTSAVNMLTMEAVCKLMMCCMICKALKFNTLHQRQTLVSGGGVIWPQESMHYLLKMFNWLLPLTLSTDAYRGIASRAWGLRHPVVYQGFLSCLGWIVGFLLISYLTIIARKGIGSK